jgi:hypothetical protein
MARGPQLEIVIMSGPYRKCLIFGVKHAACRSRNQEQLGRLCEELREAMWALGPGPWHSASSLTIPHEQMTQLLD